MRNYPYCIDFEWINGIFDEINEVIEIQLPIEKIITIKDSMRIMIKECFYESIETRCIGKKRKVHFFSIHQLL